MKFNAYATRAAVAAAAFFALQGAAFADTYSSFASNSVYTVAGFTTETDSVGNNYLKPMAPAGSTVSSYSVLSTNPGFATTGTLTFAAPTTSFTFLWGSPDTFNTVTDGVKTVNGGSFSSGSGNNAESQVYTFTDTTAFSKLTFTTQGVAFEVAAVTPVPEPETYALMLAGLGVLGFVARRRKSV